MITIIKYSSTVILRGAGALSLFLLTWALSYLLSKEEAGRFFHTYSLVMLFAPIALMGLNHIAIKFIALATEGKDPSAVRGFLLASTVIVLSVTIIGSAIWHTVASQLYLAPPRWTLLALVISSVTCALLLSYVLQGLSRPNLSVLCQSIIPPFACVILLFALGRDGQLLFEHAIKLYATGAIFSASVALVVFVKSTGFGPISWPKALSSGNSVLFFWIVSLGTAIINWSPMFLLGTYSPPAVVAEFNIAQRIAMSLALLQVAVAMIVSPRLAVLYDQARTSELELLMRRIVFTLTALSLPIAGFIHFFKLEILGLFNGNYTALAPTLISLFLVIQALNVMTGPSNQLLLMAGKEKNMAMISLTSSVLSITTTLLLLPTFGPIGAAAGMFVGLTFQNLSAALVVYKKLGLRIYSLR